VIRQILHKGIPGFWEITEGVLPPGSQLNERTGEISCTPEQDAVFPVTIKFSNRCGEAIKDINIITLKPPDTPDISNGTNINYHLTAPRTNNPNPPQITGVCAGQQTTVYLGGSWRGRSNGTRHVVTIAFGIKDTNITGNVTTFAQESYPSGTIYNNPSLLTIWDRGLTGSAGPYYNLNGNNNSVISVTIPATAQVGEIYQFRITVTEMNTAQGTLLNSSTHTLRVISCV